MLTCINEIHAHVAMIESHAYTMPTISEVHHIYTEPITTIQNDLCINPGLNQMGCVAGPGVFNVNITEPNVLIKWNKSQMQSFQEKCVHKLQLFLMMY